MIGSIDPSLWPSCAAVPTPLPSSAPAQTSCNGVSMRRIGFVSDTPSLTPPRVKRQIKSLSRARPALPLRGCDGCFSKFLMADNRGHFNGHFTQTAERGGDSKPALVIGNRRISSTPLSRHNVWGERGDAWFTCQQKRGWEMKGWSLGRLMSNPGGSSPGKCTDHLLLNISSGRVKRSRAVQQGSGCFSC